MIIEASNFVEQGLDNSEQWSCETTYYRLTRIQVGGRLLLRKSLKSKYLNDSNLRETLRKEYEIGTIIGMDTDYVVNYYQMVDIPEECYLTMDFVEGYTISEYVAYNPDLIGRQGNMERLLLQLLEGLRSIHRNQVVHLDLKPSNIMLTHVSRDIRIIDLGFCYSDSYQTSIGMTDSFASPEQLDGSGDVDARSDIYSIGRLLVWLAEELGTHCQWKKKKVFKKMINRCLCKHKNDRWQSVDEMIDFLKQSRANKKLALRVSFSIFFVCFFILLYNLFERPTIGYDEHILYGKFSLVDRTCQVVGKIAYDLSDPRWQGNLYVSSEVKHWGLTFKVNEIADYAFTKDTSFVTVNLPTTLTRIGAYSFKECTKLIEANIPDNVEEIGAAAFWGDSSLCNIKLPSSIKKISEACFHLCAFSSIEIPEGVTSIELDAFAVCKNLHEVHLPKALSRMGRGVFWRCESLESITMPSGLSSIGEYALMGCANLRQVENRAFDPQPVMSLFDDSIPELHLFVPAISVEKFKLSPEWNRLIVEPLDQ